MGRWNTFVSVFPMNISYVVLPDDEPLDEPPDEEPPDDEPLEDPPDEDPPDGREPVPEPVVSVEPLGK